MEKAFTELVSPSEQTRVYAHPLRPGVADSAPSGRIRLDAMARWLQDIAYADVDDLGLADRALWVVRRTRLRIRRFPRFAEHLTLRTFCSGLGRMWAERRTSITSGGRLPDVEAVSLWVHLDPKSWRPIPFGENELEIYRSAAAGRRVSARLRHAPPGSVQGTRSWRFRAAEQDLAGHINNAAYWTPLEEDLLGDPASPMADPESFDAEIEYRTPSQPGEKLVLREGSRLWIVSTEGEVHASLCVAESF